MAVSLWAETQNACEGGELGSVGHRPNTALFSFLSDRRRLFDLPPSFAARSTNINAVIEILAPRCLSVRLPKQWESYQEAPTA